MLKTRIESDSMGELDVPELALYGAQTQRAVNNFPISGQSMPKSFITALLQVKSAAAQANGELAVIDESQADAIVAVCQKLLEDDALMQHFPVDVFQTGSGTSSNMNANEVIANLASQIAGVAVLPNDHVNYGQSSNDVIPTTIHVSSAIELQNRLIPALSHLKHVIEEKATSVSHYCKTGRTHLMDAMPVRMDQSLNGWSQQIQHHIERLRSIQPALQKLAQGGTAVGTGVNAAPGFPGHFVGKLSAATDIEFKVADDFFAAIGSQDTVVSLSGHLKAIAVTMMKIANDLRWMNSGPLAGLGEIALPALQPGSSIMPGKVNPVIPEAVAMASAQVIGNDTAITIGGQSGNFELNVMLPMIAMNILNSINLLSQSAIVLADKAIEGFTVNVDHLNHALDRNPILVTALNPIIGYNKAADIAKQAYRENRPVVDVALEHTDLSRTELEDIMNPMKLTGV